MEIVEFNYDFDLYFEDYELLFEGIKYYEDSKGITIYNIVDFIVDFYEATGIKGATSHYEVLEKSLETLPRSTQKDMVLGIEEWTEEKFDGVLDLLASGYTGELLDFIHNEFEYGGLEEWIEDGLLPSNNFQSGIVGHSQWAYFIAHENVDTNYIRSIWDGADFYTISRLDDKGDILDSIGKVYAEDTETLIDHVSELIGDVPYMVVDNEVSLSMNVPKLEKLRHVEYTFRSLV